MDRHAESVDFVTGYVGQFHGWATVRDIYAIMRIHA
jgi:hypothetical protein